MQIVPIDIVEVLAVFMGISIVLVPVIGLTARFALKPTVEAFSRFFEHKGLDESVHILERRMALMEQQIESMEASLTRLAEVSEFHRALEAGEGAGTSGKEAGSGKALEAGRAGSSESSGGASTAARPERPGEPGGSGQGGRGAP